MPLVTVTPASTLPVTLTEAKNQCRVTGTDHDTVLTQHIWDAVANIERLTGCKLSPCTVRLDLDGFGDCMTDPVDLGVYPVRSITSVKHDDEDGTEQTLNDGSPLDYWSQLEGMYPKIVPTTYWPQTQDGKPASVRVVMSAGFSVGLSPDSRPIPRDLCRAVLARVEEYWDSTVDHGDMINALIDPWRRRFL